MTLGRSWNKQSFFEKKRNTRFSQKQSKHQNQSASQKTLKDSVHEINNVKDVEQFVHTQISKPGTGQRRVRSKKSDEKNPINKSDQ